MSKIFYLCDGEREDCKKRRCYKNGGDCMHTTDIRHAINFHQVNPKNEDSSFYENGEVPIKQTQPQKGISEARNWLHK